MTQRRTVQHDDTKTLTKDLPKVALMVAGVALIWSYWPHVDGTGHSPGREASSDGYTPAGVKLLAFSAAVKEQMNYADAVWSKEVADWQRRWNESHQSSTQPSVTDDAPSDWERDGINERLRKLSKMRDEHGRPIAQRIEHIADKAPEVPTRPKVRPEIQKSLPAAPPRFDRGYDVAPGVIDDDDDAYPSPRQPSPPTSKNKPIHLNPPQISDAVIQNREDQRQVVVYAATAALPGKSEDWPKGLAICVAIGLTMRWAMKDLYDQSRHRLRVATFVLGAPAAVALMFFYGFN